MSKPTLVLGTHNQKKLRELQLLLQPHGFNLKSLTEIEHPLEVEETGTTFQENAQLKATKQARHLKMWVIAEDSGLSVDALHGNPGVYSARFSGEYATDKSNNEKLLDQLANVPREKRTAFYTCHITLSNPDGLAVLDCEQYCRGLIRHEPAGREGFGYDPLFELPEYGLTFGQMGDSVKSVLSHRARAVRQFCRQISVLSFS